MPKHNDNSSKSLSEQITQSPDYRRMVALVKISWLVSHVHDADARYPDFPSTPHVKGFKKTHHENALATFCGLVADTVDADYKYLDLDERDRGHSKEHKKNIDRNKLDIVIRDGSNAPHFILRLQKKTLPQSGKRKDAQTPWEADDILTALGAASQAFHLLDSEEETGQDKPVSVENYLKDHRLYLHCLTKSGLGFLKSFLPGRDIHVRKVTESTVLGVSMLGSILKDSGAGWDLSADEARLLAITGYCHDLGSSMLEWMALENKDPVIHALRKLAAKTFKCDTKDPQAIDACLNLAVGRISATKDSRKLHKAVEAGELEGIANWSELLKYLSDWHSEFIEISTRSPSLIGIRAAALHHMDFRGDLSGPAYLETYRDEHLSLIDAILPIMDKLDAGYTGRQKKADREQQPFDAGEAFSQSLHDLALSIIGTNGSRVSNAAVDVGLLRALFEHGVFDAIAEKSYETTIPSSARELLRDAFEQRGIPPYTPAEMTSMFHKDRDTGRWVRRINLPEADFTPKMQR